MVTLADISKNMYIKTKLISFNDYTENTTQIGKLYISNGILIYEGPNNTITQVANR